jgi:hypothetical protein
MMIMMMMMVLDATVFIRLGGDRLNLIPGCCYTRSRSVALEPWVTGPRYRFELEAHERLPFKPASMTSRPFRTNLIRDS